MCEMNANQPEGVEVDCPNCGNESIYNDSGIHCPECNDR